MFEAERTVFDENVKRIRTMGIKSATLTERTKQSWSEGAGYDRRVSLTGTGAPQESIKLTIVEEAISASLSSRFTFHFGLSKGQRFPTFEAMRRIGYSEEQTLVHLPGEILVVLVLSTIKYKDPEPCLDKIQTLFKEDIDLDGLPVRIVAIWIRTGPEEALMTQVNKEWTMMQHWAIEGLNDRQPYNRLLDGFDTPLAYVVDPKGIVAESFKSVEELFPTKLKERIIQLARPSPQSRVISTVKEEQQPLEENLGRRIEDIFEMMSQLRKKMKSCRIELKSECERHYSNGRVTYTKIEPLTITYMATRETVEEYEEVKDKILKKLGSNHYILNRKTDDEELSFQFLSEKRLELLKKHQLSGTPTTFVTHKLNFLTGSAWKTEYWVGSSQIAYEGARNIKKIRKFVEDLNEYRKGLSFDKLFATGRELPVRVQDTPFFGIHSLRDYLNGSPRNIVSHEGVVQFVLIFGRTIADVNDRIIRQYAEAVAKYPDKAQLHLISVEGRLAVIDDLLFKASASTHGYMADAKTNDDLFVVNESAVNCGILVNGSGQLLYLDTMRNTEEVEMAIFDPSFHNKISKEFVERLENLPNENRFKEVQARLNALPYQAVVELVYIEEYVEGLKRRVAVRRPTISIAVMKKDNGIVAPLLRSLQGEGSIGSEINPIELLPEEAQCRDCLLKIQSPYYYFPTSKFYRCVACTEVEDFTSHEKMLRFPVMENALLFFGDRTVNPISLGSNLQPQNQGQCRYLNFDCSGCQTTITNQPFYYCVGCWDYVGSSNCLQVGSCCIKILCGSNQGRKEGVFRNILKSKKGHTINHNFLRVLHSPRTPTEF